MIQQAHQQREIEGFLHWWESEDSQEVREGGVSQRHAMLIWQAQEQQKVFRLQGEPGVLTDQDREIYRLRLRRDAYRGALQLAKVELRQLVNGNGSPHGAELAVEVINEVLDDGL
ncbi:hypothetical protein IB275_30410 [Pseudomonas sp. PDM21]|uniref:hypothetical protein n=1 Tax=Pseudomonas sp. PDM21 TaxID=2769257 RepID=UPI001785C78F|nr:hypothetical protein [Pseudomonas sp. PDM21]MBD9674929.1 hypothetical protein [Pseudomonas sp. PDM21]